jgi:hypothetical protein
MMNAEIRVGDIALFDERAWNQIVCGKLIRLKLTPKSKHHCMRKIIVRMRVVDA